MTKSPKPTNSITLQSGSKIERYDVTPEQMAAICAAMELAGIDHLRCSAGLYSVEDIRAAVNEACGFDFGKSKSQRIKYIIPRHTFYYLCTKHKSANYSDLGRAAGKDHTFARHGFIKVRNMLDTEDPIYTAFVHQVENFMTIKKQTK
jgi:hypothetical protein